jgi:hypothetical protein
MKKHIFLDSVVNTFGGETNKVYYNNKPEIKNGDYVLLMTPLTEITHYFHNKFKNHTLLGSVDSRNYYGFDTNEGIFLVYPPIPFSTKPALQASYVIYFENKEDIAQHFLPKKNDPLYDYEYNQEKYHQILQNLVKISPSNDDSNNLKNIIVRIESIRKSNAPMMFEKSKLNLK